MATTFYKRRVCALFIAATILTTGLTAANTKLQSDAGQRAYTCNTAVRDATGNWTRSQMTLWFTADDGVRTRRFVHRRYDAAGQLDALVTCRIPAIAGAADAVKRLLNAEPPAAGGGLSLQTMSDPTLLDPLVVTACPSGYTGDWPDCDPPDFPSNEPVPISTPTGGGGGGGTNSGPPPPTPPDPDDPPPSDPCKTGNPVLDSKEVQDGMKALWDKSNASAEKVWERIEQGGWIVQKPDGTYYVFEWPPMGNDFGTIGGCDGFSQEEVNGMLPPEGAGAIVGFVHTHPYLSGETIYDRCNNYMPQSYSGHESIYDRAASVALGKALGKTPLLGWVIDKTGISGFAGYEVARVVWKRCGY